MKYLNEETAGAGAEGSRRNQHRRIYLDYAATTPVYPEVLEAMLPYLSGLDGCFGNPSSLYAEGKQAQAALEQARQVLARAVGASPLEIVFCSGGTEAIATVMGGMAQAVLNGQGRKPRARHVLCAAFEHHAVLDNCRALRRRGFEVELLRPRRDGHIHVSDLEAALRSDTLMVTVSLAQNELGCVMPVADLATAAHKQGAYFFTDAVQGLGKLPINLADLGVDAAAFSAHKLGGPKGAGAFFLRSDLPFLAEQLGGGQERGRRSGTQNVAGAVGFAQAAKLHSPSALAREAQRLAALRDDLMAGLLALSNRIRASVPISAGDVHGHLPGHVHVLVEGIDSQTLVLHLDEAGIAVSGGAACSAASLKPSHVLTAIGIAPKLAHGALRITMGANTTPEHGQRLLEALDNLLN
ncbi:MAG: cysteine desulfurase [Coriobacteriales bacterium]|jgi:cysteine desulfurase|nr:cysteine desulfurase [Coriobacteriales bacterium]